MAGRVRDEGKGDGGEAQRPGEALRINSLISSAFHHYDGHDLPHHLQSPQRRAPSKEFDYRELAADDGFLAALKERKQNGFFDHVLGGTPEHDQRMKEVCLAFARASNNKRAAHFRDHGILNAKAFEFREAISCYNRALELSSCSDTRHVTLANRSAAYIKTGKFAEALADAEEAAAIRPDYATAHSLVGYCKQHFGRLIDAIESYNRSLRLNPTDQSTRELLEEAKSSLTNAAAAPARSSFAMQNAANRTGLNGGVYAEPAEDQACVKHRRYLDDAARACSLQDMVTKASAADDAQLLTPDELLASVMSPPKPGHQEGSNDEPQVRQPRLARKRSIRAQALSSLVQHLPTRLKNAIGGSSKSRASSGNNYSETPEHHNGPSGITSGTQKGPGIAFHLSPAKQWSQDNSVKYMSPPANSMNIPSLTRKTTGHSLSPSLTSAISSVAKENSGKCPPPLELSACSPAMHSPGALVDERFTAHAWTPGGGGQEGRERVTGEANSFVDIIGPTKGSYLTPPHPRAPPMPPPPPVSQRAVATDRCVRTHRPSADSACFVDQEFMPTYASRGGGGGGDGQSRNFGSGGAGRAPEFDPGKAPNSRSDGELSGFYSGGRDSADSSPAIAVTVGRTVLADGVDDNLVAPVDVPYSRQNENNFGMRDPDESIRDNNHGQPSADNAAPLAFPPEPLPTREPSGGMGREDSEGGAISPDTVTYNDEKLPPPPRPKTPPIYYAPPGGCPGTPMDPGLVRTIERRIATGYYGDPDDTPERAPFLPPEQVMALRRDGPPRHPPATRVDPGNGRRQYEWRSSNRPLGVGIRCATAAAETGNVNIEGRPGVSRLLGEPLTTARSTVFAPGVSGDGNTTTNNKNDVLSQNGRSRDVGEGGAQGRLKMSGATFLKAEGSIPIFEGQLRRDRDGHLCVARDQNAARRTSQVDCTGTAAAEMKQQQLGDINWGFPGAAARASDEAGNDHPERDGNLLVQRNSHAAGGRPVTKESDAARNNCSTGGHDYSSVREQYPSEDCHATGDNRDQGSSTVEGRGR